MAVIGWISDSSAEIREMQKDRGDMEGRKGEICLAVNISDSGRLQRVTKSV